MKTLIRIPLLAALGLAAAALFAQGEFRELGATPPAAETKAAKNARYSSEPSKGKTTARISFSDRTKPGLLRINVAAGKIEIEGGGGNEVVVTSEIGEKGAAQIDADGFRRLDKSGRFELVEKDNVVTLQLAGSADGAASFTDAEFEIKVPRNTNIAIVTAPGREIEIDDIDGDIEINGGYNQVSLDNVTGAVVVNTKHGKIDAEFKRAPRKPVFLTSMAGPIEVSLPPKAAASLRMRTVNGAVRTNFPESALKLTTVTAAEAAAAKSDDELVETIVESRKEQALDYADKGLAAAQRGMAAAIQAIDNIPNLSTEEKELIKRKIQAGSDNIPRTARAPKGAPRVGGKTITGELNGGGVDIQLTTMNGTITLKREK